MGLYVSVGAYVQVQSRSSVLSTMETRAAVAQGNRLWLQLDWLGDAGLPQRGLMSQSDRIGFKSCLFLAVSGDKLLASAKSL